MKSAAKYRDLVLPLSIIACIGVILIPLPAAVMDLLLLANITISLVVLLTTIHVRAPLEFSVFPTVLLATTLGRLVLNVATTRLILTQAPQHKADAAGGMIRAFGEFVAGDVLLVGIVIFAILVIIQFLVITKGATRVSEVAARFALDGMPGKQMAVDADLASGAIDETEAKRRREEIVAQADFYGAMDGATKFVRGDAIAAMLITAINIAVGLYLGIAAGMELGEAFQTFTKLTIGDGLVSQLPALLISLATALLVTRSTQQTNLPSRVLGQLSARPEALLVSGCFLGALVFTGLPKLPLLMLGSACVGLAVLVRNQQRAEQVQREQAAAATQTPATARQPEEFLAVDPVRIEIGSGLLAIADPGRGGDLMDRISAVRTGLASEMGFLLPKVRLKDNLAMEKYNYRILLGGNLVEQGTVFPDRLLAIAMPGSQEGLAGQPALEPASGHPALWIDEDQQEDAIAEGYRVVTAGQAIAMHLEKTARRHAPELLTREAAKQLVGQLRKVSPTVVDELLPDVLKLSQVQAVLKRLLAEDVPIRQLGIIFEALSDHAPRSQDLAFLVEKVRQRLARTLTQRLADHRGRLHVIGLDKTIEDRIADSLEHRDGEPLALLSQEEVQALCEALEVHMRQLESAGHPCVLLVRPRLRYAIRDLTALPLPELHVLSHTEVSLQAEVDVMASVATPVHQHAA